MTMITIIRLMLSLRAGKVSSFEYNGCQSILNSKHVCLQLLDEREVAAGAFPF